MVYRRPLGYEAVRKAKNANEIRIWCTTVGDKANIRTGNVSQLELA